MKRKLAALLAALMLFLLSAQALAVSEPEPPMPPAPVENTEPEEPETPEEPVMPMSEDLPLIDTTDH